MMVDFDELQKDIKKNTEILVSVSDKLKLLNTDCYLNFSEAAKYLKMSESNLRRYKDEIVHFRRERSILFKKSDLDAWVLRYSS